MEDNWDSLIYIIITIVAFAISAMGKKKKKQAYKPSVSQKSETYNQAKKEEGMFSGLEKLIREQVGIEDPYALESDSNSTQNEEEVMVDKTSSEILDSVPPEMLDDKEDFPYSIEYDDTSEIFKDSIKDKDLTTEEEYTVLENFNLRDAVIYSEIINRKEY